MARFPGAVTIVTPTAGGGPYAVRGITATAVCSVSADPPCISQARAAQPEQINSPPATGTTTPTAPPSLTDADLTFCCTVPETLQTGSHGIFISQITSLTHGNAEALIYAQSGFHRLAPI